MIDASFGNIENSMTHYDSYMSQVQSSFDKSFAAQVAMNEITEQQHLRVAMENARSQGVKAAFDKISY